MTELSAELAARGADAPRFVLHALAMEGGVPADPAPLLGWMQALGIEAEMGGIIAAEPDSHLADRLRRNLALARLVGQIEAQAAENGFRWRTDKDLWAPVLRWINAREASGLLLDRDIDAPALRKLADHALHALIHPEPEAPR